MPELPEVETIKNAIAKAIGCARITEAEVRNPFLRVKVPADLAANICGSVICGYRRIAKYIIIDLDNGFSIIWHMGMSGKVKICEDRPQPIAKHDYIIIGTNHGWLVFNDPRRFGLMTFCETNCLKNHPLLSELGTEPLTEELSADYLHHRLSKKKVPIKAALLDQKIIAGIGNIYASEALYEAGISPLRPANKLSKAECQKLVTAVQKVLQKAIAAGGSTLRDYAKPDGSLGYFQHQHCVYNKTGERCPDCNCNAEKSGGIQKVIIGGRSSFYCPHKQK